MTAVKLEIGLNEIKCVRQVKVKGVYGVRKILSVEPYVDEKIYNKV